MAVELPGLRCPAVKDSSELSLSILSLEYGSSDRLVWAAIYLGGALRVTEDVAIDMRESLASRLDGRYSTIEPLDAFSRYGIIWDSLAMVT